MRIALIHALKHSPPPIESAFSSFWPEAKLCHLLDDSLSRDLAEAGAITPEMTQRFIDLGRYVRKAGADAILFTCSAFGPCIEACAKDLTSIPVLKPNEAMLEQASKLGGRVGLLATFEPTLRSMPREFSSELTVVPKFVPGALAALDRGDYDAHDEIAANVASELIDCDFISLAQFSLARAAEKIERRTGKRVLTTPGCAVLKLRHMLGSRQS